MRTSPYSRFPARSAARTRASASCGPRSVKGYCTAAGLMGELGISRSAVTGQIRPLVAAGLLVAETDLHNTNLVGRCNRRRWRIDAVAFDDAVNDFRRTITGHK
ncbi:hypothetical protein [Lacisediminihabitans sp. H27-G8]|uniref:hypothetical protein n=1 Tax=Lacisediminihabitans sp. H27-G8 TaxID=3111909 RepID=UPI0038FC846D